MCRRFRIVVCCLVLALAGARADAGTLVAFNWGSLGTVHIDLFDDLTPITVPNFLGYVNADAYDGSVIHRITQLSNPAEGFGVIQGGGFKYSDATQSFSAITSGSQIQNEFQRANTRGTIAMARTTGLHTATNQWFINTSNNSTVFNAANPYAVFGWVIGGGMSTVDHIGALTAGGMVPRNFSGPSFYSNGNFARLPVSQTYTQANYDALVKPTSSQMAVLQSVSVVSVHPDFQNPLITADVDNNNAVEPLDALFIINDLLAHGNAQHAVEGPFAGVAYLDPSGNDVVGAIDALMVINELIAQSNLSLLAQPLLTSDDASLDGASLASPMAASFNSSMGAVPEPSTIALVAAMLAVLGGCAVVRRLRK